MKETDRLLEVVHRLRQECPWDRKQTHQSLRPYLLEETYEAVEAIDKKNLKDLKEELGDILLQIALHAELASEKSAFSFEDVAKSIADKMIHRHPHVYKDVKVRGVEEVRTNWAKLKNSEKPERRVLEGVPYALPALQRSQRIGQRAAEVGFDWKDVKGALDKIEEELGELRAELQRKKVDRKALKLEIGDLLFSITNVCRHLKVDAEAALQESANKFTKRFNRVETALRKRKLAWDQCSLEDLEREWQKSKS